MAPVCRGGDAGARGGRTVSAVTVDNPSSALYHCIRDVAEFADTEGWDQPPQLFALVPTADLVAAEPTLEDQLDDGAALTPIAQEPLPDDLSGDSMALDEFLATTSWPPAVEGVVLVQQIVVLPPNAEHTLDEAIAPLLADRDAADRAGRDAAQTHPERRDARLYAGVLRDGVSLCLLQLRPEEDEAFPDLDLRTAPNLAPNLIDALRHTLENEPD
ncbi:PPA1309 family protein [Nocardia kruczakiae]|uniref:PPA1309 family protein n=1 Tax=Nocardia kruczakiae TaxID=261477 RepID=UPI000A657950